MIYSVFWTKRARKNFEATLNYLSEEWGQKVTKEFYEKVEVTIESIERNPTLYPVFDLKRNIHRCVITKRITLYYRIRPGFIDLISFWDTRQHPRKLKI
ncbi:MAG: type II toxin-antitoxin system RelE/ParE family toxin [Cytophagales bacterium]|nr:type II toxin-antitoxin system RelE/ParE family toxin [Cytophagales bacterium]